MDLVELWKAEQLAHWQDVAADVRRKQERLPLAERCSQWYRGEQCDYPRVTGSKFCVIHDGGRRFA